MAQKRLEERCDTTEKELTNLRELMLIIQEQTEEQRRFTEKQMEEQWRISENTPRTVEMFMSKITDGQRAQSTSVVEGST